jgi:hypothetical protein
MSDKRAVAKTATLTRYTPYFDWKTGELGMDEWEHGDWYAKDEVDARIAALEAERNTLSDAWNELFEAAADRLIEIGKLNAEVERRVQEVNALRADAERYRWLRDECGRSFGMGIDSPAEHSIVWLWQQAIPDEANWTLERALDAAIDAARGVVTNNGEH